MFTFKFYYSIIIECANYLLNTYMFLLDNTNQLCKLPVVLSSWAAIPGGREELQYFLGEGTAMAASHPIISHLSYTFYGSLACTCTSTVCTRIHKEQHTFLQISQDTQETQSTNFPITSRSLHVIFVYLIKVELIVHSSEGALARDGYVISNICCLVFFIVELLAWEAILRTGDYVPTQYIVLVDNANGQPPPPPPLP